MGSPRMGRGLVPLGLLSMFAFSLSGCSDGAAQGDRPLHAGLDDVTFRSLSQGIYGSQSFSGVTARVADTQPEWSDEWKRHHRGESNAPPLPPVDFAHEWVLLLFAEERGSTGHYISVDAVHWDEPNHLVTYRERAPGDGCLNSGVVTQPFHFVAVARTKTGAPHVSLESGGVVEEDC